MCVPLTGHGLFTKILIEWEGYIVGFQFSFFSYDFIYGRKFLCWFALNNKNIVSLPPLIDLGRTSGDGEAEGGLACCSPRGHKESDTTD